MAILISSKCIRKRHYWSNCHLCTSACLLQAITVGPQIHVDVAKCNQCGRCVESCPFDAIEGNKASYNISENTLYEDSQSPPTFEKLLSLKAEGINEIHVSKSHSTWLEYLEEVNALLSANKLSIFRIILSKKATEGISHSRRSLLNRLSRVREECKNNEASLSTVYPAHQLYRIEFDSTSCNICSLCEVHCPEKCIIIENNKMVFDGRKCHGCQICADVCLTKSLQINKAMHVSNMNIYSIFRCTCSACGVPYQRLSQSTGPVSLCPACEFRKSNAIPIYRIGENAD